MSKAAHATSQNFSAAQESSVSISKLNNNDNDIINNSNNIVTKTEQNKQFSLDTFQSPLSNGMPALAPPMEKEFDWAFCNSELENQDSYILMDILTECVGPISSLTDENGLTLIHHAVLKGVEGKVQILVDFAIKN